MRGEQRKKSLSLRIYISREETKKSGERQKAADRDSRASRTDSPLSLHPFPYKQPSRKSEHFGQLLSPDS